MPAKLRQVLPWIPFALLLAAVGYWNIRPQSFSSSPELLPIESDIDFFTVNSFTTQYRPDGKRQHELFAEKSEHLQSRDISLVTHPDMHLYRGTPLPWRIRSDLAEVAPHGTEVELIDHVRVERTDTKGRPVIITSTRMTVFPDKSYVQTQQPVRIEMSGVTTAVGMKAYLDQSKMYLLSNVRGEHVLR